MQLRSSHRAPVGCCGASAVYWGDRPAWRERARWKPASGRDPRACSSHHANSLKPSRVYRSGEWRESSLRPRLMATSFRDGSLPTGAQQSNWLQRRTAKDRTTMPNPEDVLEMVARSLQEWPREAPEGVASSSSKRRPD